MDGTLGAAFDVGEGAPAKPAVALDPDGDVTFAWTVDVGNDPVLARRRTVAGAFGPARTLSDAESNSVPPHLAVDAAGKATVAWYETSSDEWLARVVTPAGTMSPVRTLGADG